MHVPEEEGHKQRKFVHTTKSFVVSEGEPSFSLLFPPPSHHKHVARTRNDRQEDDDLDGYNPFLLASCFVLPRVCDRWGLVAALNPKARVGVCVQFELVLKELEF